MTSDRARRVADDAAEAIRSLNHETMRADGFEASDIYDITGVLNQTVERFPQAFRQLARILDTMHEAGRLAVDEGRQHRRASSAVSTYRTALATAAASAEALATALNDAQQAVAGIHMTERRLRVVDPPELA